MSKQDSGKLEYERLVPDTLDPRRIGEVIDACIDNLDLLTKWEQGFIESISEQWERKHSLTELQKEHLESIYVSKIP